ncbi:hypothetical protein NOR_00988 [Metarhizium rileyi]|uniref:Uncharacterized protein n=1 Tax=Metarhizium rileyi (strain RCEF 4871) TaxID=1649241 RepID=A0A162JXQ0_METRR|nr:hypothetical protein NOR_00988 [Metarhizium rileyi RCEF 4871]
MKSVPAQGVSQDNQNENARAVAALGRWDNLAERLNLRGSFTRAGGYQTSGTLSVVQEARDELTGPDWNNPGLAGFVF